MAAYDFDHNTHAIAITGPYIHKLNEFGLEFFAIWILSIMMMSILINAVQNPPYAQENMMT